MLRGEESIILKASEHINKNITFDNYHNKHLAYLLLPNDPSVIFWGFFFKPCSGAKRARSRKSEDETVKHHTPLCSPLLEVISLIWPAGEHAFKSESCLSTLVTGVDHATGTLSMNIHQFHNMPAPNIFSPSHM